MMKFFDPQELRIEYGGQISAFKDGKELIEYANVQEFILSDFKHTNA